MLYCKWNLREQKIFEKEKKNKIDTKAGFKVTAPASRNIDFGHDYNLF